MLPDMFTNNVSIFVDPNEHFVTDTITKQLVFQACGLIPDWFVEATPDETFQEIFEKNYPYCYYEIADVEIDDLGIWHYKGDPDMQPLIKIVRGEEIIYQYEHSFVAVVYQGEAILVTRMD